MSVLIADLIFRVKFSGSFLHGFFSLLTLSEIHYIQSIIDAPHPLPLPEGERGSLPAGRQGRGGKGGEYGKE